MKIGIYGGSFDPPHLDHIAIAKKALDFVDQVWLVPCYHHMFAKNMRSAKERLKYCEIAARNYKNIIVCDFEIANQLNQGTYHILSEFQKCFSHEFSLIIGQDNAEVFEKWKNHEKLIAEYQIIVFPRVNCKIEYAWYLNNPHVFVENYVSQGISSTQVRELLYNNKEEVCNYLDPEVLKAIKESNLYCKE